MLCALRVVVKSWGRAWKGQVSRELPRTNKQQRALPASVIRQDDCVSGHLGPVWSQPGSMSRRGLKQRCLEAVWKWHSPQVWLLGSTWYLRQYLIQVGKALNIRAKDLQVARWLLPFSEVSSYFFDTHKSKSLWAIPAFGCRSHGLCVQ